MHADWWLHQFPPKLTMLVMMTMRFSGDDENDHKHDNAAN